MVRLFRWSWTGLRIALAFLVATVLIPTLSLLLTALISRRILGRKIGVPPKPYVHEDHGTERSN